MITPKYNLSIELNEEELKEWLVSKGYVMTFTGRNHQNKFLATYSGNIMTYPKIWSRENYFDCGKNRALFKALAGIYDGHKLFKVLKSSSGYRPGYIYKNLHLMSNIHPGCYRIATAEEIAKFVQKNPDYFVD